MGHPAFGPVVRTAFGATALLAALAWPALAQTPADPAASPATPPAQGTPAPQGTPATGQNPPGGPPVAPDQAPPGPPSSTRGQTTEALSLAQDVARITYDDAQFFGDSGVRARNVTVTLGEYVLTGGQLDGDFQKELLFSGNPTLTYRGQTLTGNTIRFYPRTKAFRVDRLHTALTPEFLQGRLLSPLYLNGDEISGTRRGPLIGEDIEGTTCDRPSPDYLVQAGSVTVEPGKRIVLKRAAFFLWGHRIITLPTIVVPLDRRPRRFRLDNAPRVGHSQDEGWFVKSLFNYYLADRVPGDFRLDLMEKKGIGLGIDQAWNLAKTAGLLALYAIPTGGTTKNLSGRLNNRFNLGGGQLLTLDNDFQQNSYLSLPETTSLNSRIGYNRQTGTLGTMLNLARQQTDSSGYSTSSYTANIAQSYQFSRKGNVNINADYSQYSSGSSGGTTGGFSQRTEQLSTRFQSDYRESNYGLQLTANRNIPIGQSNAQSFFGGVERLPEITLSNYRFTQGPLSRLPATFLVSAGRYSEGGTGLASGSNRIDTERAVVGFDVNGSRVSLTPRTDLDISGGFQQFFYGEGAAQYILRNTTTLTQRWNRQSGLRFNYTYQRPEGGTPFRFDRQGQYHALNADLGLLDDRRLQLTARVGYDFGQAGFGGVQQPWQTLSANLLVRPLDWMRFRNLFSFDPNTSRLVSVTTDMRFRGHNDLSVDLVSRYDPAQHRFGAVNGYLNIPSGSLWRVIALFQYNGYLNRFESRNLEIVRDLHCMEASLTYTENPFGFRNDRQIFFQLRIKAFPMFQRFGTGQFGQAIDTSVGEVY